MRASETFEERELDILRNAVDKMIPETAEGERVRDPMNVLSM